MIRDVRTHDDVVLLIGDVLRALEFGDRKHGALSWKRVPTEKFLAALMRHLGKRLGGEVNDPESGIDHFAHAISNIVILYRKVK